MRSVGVEEELLLVDAVTWEPHAVSPAVLATADRAGGEGHAFQKELHGQQLEFATCPRTEMAELAAEIRELRAEAAEYAGKVGAAVAALATSPLPFESAVNQDERYLWLEREFGPVAQAQLTCGCHVHVAVESDEEGVAVLDRIRPWLSVLLALTGNSPFWRGYDSGYSSYRSRVWGRWPSAGPVELFGSATGYHDYVAAMVATGVLRDPAMAYFEARLAERYPTVEVRVADVCLDASSTVLVAALVRGLVETAAREWRAQVPPLPHRVASLRLASWRAGRSGLEDRLVDPRTMRPAPAEAVVRSLLAHVRDALRDHGDLPLAEEGLRRLLRTGNGARVQRDMLRRTGSLHTMIAECVRRTQM
ncbi:glutamate--cysteine ligase [Streptomyces lushanensis]|uniref:glutamate--cysteine ligase n=1 Tax=Streptomyces lushanensis TaxID=1434255 RepID=UPI00083001EE|nr:glutamate--cysteine ligase [Streptomyces lushanensis]